jgi:ribosomal protein S4
MSGVIKQRLSYYKKYKLDIWGIIRNSFFIETQWRKFNYCKLNRKYKMYNEARKHNLRKTINKKQDFNFGKRLNMRYVYKLKIYWNIIKKVFKIKPSKKLNKICLFFFNRKRRKRNFDWWKKKYFIYEVRDLYVKKKKYTQKKEFTDIRIAKNFYIMFTYKQLKKFVKNAKKKDGLFEQNFISFMECKLPSFMYRSSFLPNIFESIYYIKNNNVAINKVFRSSIFFPVKCMDIVTFRVWEKSYIYWSFYKRLKKKAFLFCFPKYMYVSIIFFFIICINIPKKSDIINPIAMDFYKASSFSKK